MKPVAKLTLPVLLLCAAESTDAQSVTRPSDIPLETFAQLPVMRSAELSPDGTRLAYIRPLNGRGHLIIESLFERDKPGVIPPTEDVDFDWLRWANSERIVFSVSASRKRRFTETTETRLFAVNSDGSNPAHIVLPSKVDQTISALDRDLAPAQFQHKVIHWLPDEPNHILVSLDGDHNGADEVRRIDIRDGDFDIVRIDSAGIQNWLADWEGNVRLGWGYRNNTFRMLTSRGEGQWRSADSSKWRDAGYFPQAFTNSPDIAYMTGRDEHGCRILRKANVVSDELLDIMFQEHGYDVGSLLLDPLTRQLVGVRYVEHQPRTHYFDQKLARLQRSIDAVLPETVNEIVSMTSDRRKVLIRASSDVDPGTFNFLDRDKGTLTPITEVMPGLPPALMSPVEPVSYEARDALTIPAYLTLPKGASPENLPVVVMPHGGPSARDSKSFWFLSQFLASRGYAIFQPNFRGSSGYGRAFERAGRNEWGGKMQQDITDGTRWLIEQGIADPDRLCIVGWSYGGYSAAMGAVQAPDLYQCAASINGVLNLPSLIRDDKQYIGGSVWTRHMGLEDESARVVSPFHLADEIQVPMLIIQAKDDTRVHEDQGKGMARRLQRMKKPVTYVEVELGGHGMDNEAARQTILESLESFLADNLGSD